MSPSGQNDRHFTDVTFKHIFLDENGRIVIKISLKFVPKGPINNIPALVQIMVWCPLGNKPLSEPMMVKLLMHMYVTLPQWVKGVMIRILRGTTENINTIYCLIALFANLCFKKLTTHQNETSNYDVHLSVVSIKHKSYFLYLYNQVYLLATSLMVIIRNPKFLLLVRCKKCMHLLTPGVSAKRNKLNKMTRWFPSWRANNVESVSMSCHHHLSDFSPNL